MDKKGRAEEGEKECKKGKKRENFLIVTLRESVTLITLITIETDFSLLFFKYGRYNQFFIYFIKTLVTCHQIFS
jgi:hypothetical protein